MPIDKNFYNESSAAKLGWDPTWFGEKYFDDKLTRAIKKWQKDKGLSADGLCGPATFRRLWTERQADIQTDRRTGTQTDRQADRQTDRQTDRETERQ